MPIVNSIAAMQEDLTAWRRHLHQHPELGLDCFKTAAFVVDKLREFGITDIHEGIARTGVVAIIEGRGSAGGSGRTIGLRADMDALPMDDLSGADHASTVPGMAHTCGHDGHTVMLLGAAKYLAETRNFSGRVALIFQPDEEGGGGGRVMVEEGIMERFEIEEVYGIHNSPEDGEGHLATAPGPLLAAVDSFQIEITGQGGHGAMPFQTRDPIMAAVAMVQAIQTIVSRNVDALEQLVVSVTQIHAGTSHNIIPGTAFIEGTIRSFDKGVQALVMQRMAEIVEHQARVFGMEAQLTYEQGYPATVNHAAQAAFATEVAQEVVGVEKVNGARQPIMAAEDFAYMLEARPGAYLFLGQGGGPSCHHPEFDFNDKIAPVGASFFARLIEKALPL